VHIVYRQGQRPSIHQQCLNLLKCGLDGLFMEASIRLVGVNRLVQDRCVDAGSGEKDSSLQILDSQGGTIVWGFELAHGLSTSK
jgi:hypothetical protein